MHPEKTNNDKLRELVEASGLSQPVALTVFNRGFGERGYSMASWKAFLAGPDAGKFRRLKDELLVHAEKNFAKLKKPPRSD